MKGKKTAVFFGLVLTLLFGGSVYLTVMKFNEVKNQYRSIAPTLDNYSTAEILFLAFERTRTAVYKTENPNAFLISKSVFDSKLLILRNKYNYSGTFYYEPDFISALSNIEKQSAELGALYNPENPSSTKAMLLSKMDEMKPALIDLQQIIYRIQIKNFDRVKKIISDNSMSAETTALASICLLFLLMIVLWMHISKLKAAIKGKNIFISAIYHEMSGSIQKIQLACDMIDPQEGMLATQKYLAKISFHSNKLFHQTKEILEFSKIEIGNVGLNLTTFRLNEIIESSMSLFNETTNKLEFHVNLPETLIRTDKQKLISIIHNLIDNSNKNTSNGLIDVRIRLTDRILMIRVSDNGCGFDMRKLKFLYKPFNQGAESETRQGLGLGLTIVNSYIKTMSGSIKANSEIGKGTTFTLRIPVARVS